MNEIILASASIGRKKLFQKYFNNFRVSISHIDESRIKIPDPFELTKRLSYLKASAISKFYQNDYVFGFDTVVVCDSKIIGKPKNKEEAKEILKFLSGKKQSVITGFSIINMEKNIEIIDADETIVYFKSLSDDFINDYVSNNPVIKFAGGYGIQDNDQFIDIIEGDLDNVIGAPMKKIINIIINLGLNHYLKEETNVPA